MVDWINTNWELVLAILTVVEILLRSIPTLKNFSIVDNFVLIWGKLFPNKSKDGRKWKLGRK